METMSHDPHEDDAALREELVAYLDGELSVEHSRRVEERARVEPDTRRMLEEFDRTWHMLDELESPATNEDFTRTTLEMVALAAVDDAAKAKAEAPRARRRIRLWTAGGLAAAAVIGFALVAAFAPDPNAPLLQDLPLLENYHQYHEVVQVGGIEFLRALSANNPFPNAADAAVPVDPRTAGETISQRRKVVAAMTAEERDDVFRNEQAFREQLSPEVRRQMRELYAAIEADPDRDKLLAVMNRYCEWFDALPPIVSDQLQQQKKPEERVAAIKKLLEKGPFAGIEIRLDGASRLGLAGWMDRYTEKHEAQILQQIAARGGMGRPPGGPLRLNPNGRPEGETAVAGWARQPPQWKRLKVREWLQRSLLSDRPAQRPSISDAEMASLRASLSDAVRKNFDSHKPKEQYRIISGWLHETFSPDFDEQLAEFFETIKPAEVRDRLMALPVDDMYRELRRMYITQANAGEGPRFGDPRNRPDRGRRGGRTGGAPGQRGGGSGGGRRGMDEQQGPPLDFKGERDPSSQGPATNKPADTAK